MPEVIPPLHAKVLKCPECRNGYIGKTSLTKCEWCQGKGYRIEQRAKVEMTPHQRFERSIAVTNDRRITANAERIIREGPIGTRTAQQRREDGHCTDCGNPQLATRTRCASCAEEHRRKNRIGI